MKPRFKVPSKFSRTFAFLLCALCWPLSADAKTAVTPPKDSSSNLSYMKGRQFALDGNYDKAAPLLEKALAESPEDPFLNHQLAEVYLHLGEYERAEKLGKKALEKDPENEEYLTSLASIYAGLKKYDEAKAQYRKILTSNPKNRRAPLFLGILEAEQGNYKEGVKVLTEAIESSTDSTMAYFYRAKIHLENNDIESAKKDLASCLTNRPSFVDAGTALGLLHERLGEIDEAISVYTRIQGTGRFKKRLAQLYLQKNEFEKALSELLEYEKVETDDYTARVKLALIYFELENFEESEKRLLAILKEQPQADVHFYLGAIFEQKKQFDKALAEYKKVSDNSASFKESRLHMGFIYREQNKIKEGQQFSEKLLEKFPDVTEFYDLTASFFESKKDYKGAVKAIQKGLVRAPKDERLLYFEAALFEKLGDRSKAINSMKKVLEVNEKNPQALNFLGYTYAEMDKNLEEAEKMILKALEIRPKDGFIVDSLGWVYYKQGKFDKALEKLEAALVLQPQEPVILEHLGDVHLKQKNFDRAASFYKKAVDISANKKDEEMSKKLKEKLVAIDKERVPTGKAN